MKVAILGSRSAGDSEYELLCQFVPVGASEIFSGGACGADALAVRYATENGLPLRTFLPNYEKFGRRAPLLRNEEMVDAADYVLAVWDGQSRGTSHAVCAALSSQTPVRLLRFEKKL